MRKIDLLGRTFNRLVVIGTAPNADGGKAAWMCRCQCGVEKRVEGYLLTRGLVKSCGCHRRIGKTNLRHGHTIGGVMSRTFACWHNIIDRCDNQNNHAFEHYGGRGIKICDRWRAFDNFLADMGEMPSGLQIDRIDNNDDYEPFNCRWTTALENSRNRRKPRKAA